MGLKFFYIQLKTLIFTEWQLLIQKIKLLKIDAEGNELNILLGSEKLLTERKINVIYVEISERKENFKHKSNEIKRYLESFGFRLEKSHRIKSLGFLSNLNATDNLFIR